MAKGSSITMYTSLGSSEAASIIRLALNDASSDVKFEHIPQDRSSSRDGSPIAEFAQGKEGGIFKKMWGLQFEIYDEGPQRRVFVGVHKSSHSELAAAAFSQKDFFRRADAIGEINFNEKLGMEKAQLVMESLKKADRNLTVR